MTSFFYKNVPAYFLDKFRAVRDSIDNIDNLLNIAEIVNSCHHCLCDRDDHDYDLAIFSRSFSRALVRRGDGYFSMAIPFQLVSDGGAMHFNFDQLAQPLSGQLISRLRNAATTWRERGRADDVSLSLCESFGLEIEEAIEHCDAFVSLLSQDHGYFRFDDDQDNEDGDIHPRYHFDFFFKNSATLKIGSLTSSDIGYFYAFCDPSLAKKYLR